MSKNIIIKDGNNIEILCDCFQLPSPYENIYIPKKMYIPNGFMYSRNMFLSIKSLTNHDWALGLEIHYPIVREQIDDYFTVAKQRPIIDYLTFKCFSDCKTSEQVWALTRIWSDPTQLDKQNLTKKYFLRLLSDVEKHKRNAVFKAIFFR
jgi:hypothetical protein